MYRLNECMGSVYTWVPPPSMQWIHVLFRTKNKSVAAADSQYCSMQDDDDETRHQVLMYDATRECGMGAIA